MLELEVRLPRETRKIEWDKASPTFCEVKQRLESCGVAKNWCVEILRGDEYLSPDDDAQLKNIKKLIVRASPIGDRRLLQQFPSADSSTADNETGESQGSTTPGPKPNLAEMFETVINYVGRVYVCERDCKQADIVHVDNCKGTVGLVGCGGESIGCWHILEAAVNKPTQYKFFIQYPNYAHNLAFEAQIKDNLISSDLDLFVAEPIETLPYETAHLQCALDVSLADTVHCFGFPEVVDREIILGYKNRKHEGQIFADSEVERRLKLPTIFSGRVCFNGWKQAVADYLCFPNCSGGILVDDYGHLKGVHVAGFRVGQKLDFRNLRVTKTRAKAPQRIASRKSKSQPKLNLRRSLQNLYAGVNSFCSDTACCLNACRNEVAAFVPVQIFEEQLELARLRLIRCTGSKPSRDKPRKSRLQEEDDDTYKNPKRVRSHRSHNPLIWLRS